MNISQRRGMMIHRVNLLLVGQINHLIIITTLPLMRHHHLLPLLQQTGMVLPPPFPLEAEDVKVLDEDGHPDEEGEDLAVAPLVFVVGGGDVLFLLAEVPEEADVDVGVEHGVGGEEDGDDSAPGDLEGFLCL